MMDWIRKIVDIETSLGAKTTELARLIDTEPRFIYDIKSSKSKNPSASFVESLIVKAGVNPVWLFQDESAPVLQKDVKSATVAHLKPATAPPKPVSLTTVESDDPDLGPIKNHDRRGVPYYDIEATAHIAEVLDGGDRAPEYYVDFQPFNDCTAYLQVYGSSMYPAITSGEVVAVKEIKNFDVILWGEMYLVIANADQNDLRAVKTVHQHEDDSKIILRSSNPNFKGDTVIPKESIIKMFLVKGKISRGHL